MQIHTQDILVTRLMMSKKVNNIKCQKGYMCKHEEAFGCNETFYDWIGGNGYTKITEFLHFVVCKLHLNKTLKNKYTLLEEHKLVQTLWKTIQYLG